MDLTQMLQKRKWKPIRNDCKIKESSQGREPSLQMKDINLYMLLVYPYYLFIHIES